jgi:hypothetical protein
MERRCCRWNHQGCNILLSLRKGISPGEESIARTFLYAEGRVDKTRPGLLGEEGYPIAMRREIKGCPWKSAAG